MSTLNSQHPAVRKFQTPYGFFGSLSCEKRPFRMPVHLAKGVQKQDCTIQILPPAIDLTDPFKQHESNFLNYLFIARLRAKCKEPKVDINSQRYDKFSANLGGTQIDVQSQSISLTSPSAEELKKTLRELAVLMYNAFPKLNLQLCCEDKILEKELKGILDQACLEVNVIPSAPAWEDHGIEQACLA